MHGPFTPVVNPYAPQPRLAVEATRQVAQQFMAQSDLRNLLDAVPSFLLILNPQRQVCFANRATLGLLGLASPEAICGMRPGEVLDCEHAFESGGGCGMSAACATCGAAKALATCERGAAAVQECRITQKRSGKAIDLRVSATPFQMNGQPCTVLALTDTSHENRRRALERIFFHDLLNHLGAVMGYAQLLRTSDAGELGELSESITRLAGTLAEEIRAQRELLAAERNDLTVHWELLGSRAVLAAVAKIYLNHEVSRDRRLVIADGTADVSFRSDQTLLVRVLGNLVKNALEACLPGQTVTIGARPAGPQLEFWVHNPGSMPREVQLQVFQRSFSTKGAGRGLGTYSIKLLTERYLRGQVSFTSSPDQGTTFRVSYPLGRE